MIARTCHRHRDLVGPYWCQDCHGVHDIGRPDPDARFEREPTEPSKPRQPSATELAEMQRNLRETLALLRRAREEGSEWYVWVLEQRDRRENAPA